MFKAVIFICCDRKFEDHISIVCYFDNFSNHWEIFVVIFCGFRDSW